MVSGQIGILAAIVIYLVAMVSANRAAVIPLTIST